jgi:uncharacterized phiE125 gp8 family phage protein
MGLSLVTAPTSEPLSLAEAKAHLRVDITTDDALIAGYILAARKWAEGYVRGCISRQTWDYTLDGNWPLVVVDGVARNRIYLPLHPVREFTTDSPQVSAITVSYVDDNGATQTLSSALYTVHVDGPVAYIQKAYGASWPTVRDVPEAVTVRFQAGYDADSVPDDLRTAIMLHVELMYDRDNLSRETLERARDTLLDPHRMLRVL